MCENTLCMVTAWGVTRACDLPCCAQMGAVTSFDLTTSTYLVDTRCEGTLPEHTQASRIEAGAV